MLYEEDNFYTAQTRRWQVISNAIRPPLYTHYSAFTDTYLWKPDGNYQAFLWRPCLLSDTATFVHGCWEWICLLTLIFQTHFPSSSMCQSNLKSRTLQEQGIKRRQGTECTSREYFPDVRNNSHQNPKDGNCPELLREILKAASFFYYYYYFYYRIYSSIILWCII